MRTDRIIVVGLLSDEIYRRRMNIGRMVVHPGGISKAVCAAYGMGGGITLKVLMLYED